MPDESYCRLLRSLLLYLCYVFRALINSLVCWLPWTLSIMKEEADRCGHETRWRTTINRPTNSTPTCTERRSSHYQHHATAVLISTSAHWAFKLMESCAIKVNTILLLLFIIIIILKKAEHPPREKVWPKAVQLQTHQTLRQQGETGEDGHIHLADCTFNVAAIEKKKKKKKDTTYTYCCVLI